MDELFTATAGEGSTWRKFFENPTTAQYDRRVLAMSTYLAMAQLFALSRHAAVREALPPAALRATTAAFAMVNVQAALGIFNIFTLLYLVPVPPTSTHQAGSIMLLTAVLHVVLALR